MEDSFLATIEGHEVIDARQTEIHTAEPPVPEPSVVQFELAIGKLKRHKSPDKDEIPAELIKAGGNTIHSEVIDLLILFCIRRNCLRIGRSRSLCLSMWGC